MTTCKNCRREHEPVPFAAWAWGFSRSQPKPPGVFAGILFVAARLLLDTETGCGKFTHAQLAEAYGPGASADTAKRAMKWATDHKVFRCAVRGRKEGDKGEPSHYESIRIPQQGGAALLGNPNRAEDSSQQGGAASQQGGAAPPKRSKRSKEDRSSRDPLYDELHAVDPSLTMDRFLLMLKRIDSDERVCGDARAYAAGALKKHHARDETAVPNLIRKYGSDYEAAESWMGCCGHRSSSHTPAGCSECASGNGPCTPQQEGQP